MGRWTRWVLPTVRYAHRRQDPPQQPNSPTPCDNYPDTGGERSRRRSDGGVGRGDDQTGGGRWPNGSACRGGPWGQTAQADRSVVELVGQRLVEHEVWRWVPHLRCARRRRDRRPESGRAGSLLAAALERVRSGEVCVEARGAPGWPRLHFARGASNTHSSGTSPDTWIRHGAH